MVQNASQLVMQPVSVTPLGGAIAVFIMDINPGVASLIPYPEFIGPQNSFQRKAQDQTRSVQMTLFMLKTSARKL